MRPAFERGYVEGKSLVIEYRWAEGRYDQLDALAADLVRLPVDALFAATTAAALAARNATATIPIIVANVGAPVESGLVASLARPGGNITGLAYYVSPEIGGKQLELLREVGSRVSRVAVLWNPGNQGGSRFLEEAKKAAELLRMKLHAVEAQGPDDFEGAFRTMAEEGADGLLVVPDAVLSEHRAELGHWAVRGGLPTMFGSREDLADGVLMAYGASRLDLIRRAAGFVDRILKGAQPSELPIEQPTTFELVINLKAARALGMEVPPALLARADEVLE